MAVYKSFDALVDHQLKQGDEVFFTPRKGKTLRHTVENSFLNCIDHSNVLIFDELGIVDPYKCCSDIYGYHHRGGEFPETNNFDHEALTRIVLVLFAFCEGAPAVELLNKEKDQYVKYYLKDYQGVVAEILQLTEDYKGTFHRNYIKVGCQEIPYAKVEKVLQKAIKCGYQPKLFKPIKTRRTHGSTSARRAAAMQR